MGALQYVLSYVSSNVLFLQTAYYNLQTEKYRFVFDSHHNRKSMNLTLSTLYLHGEMQTYTKLDHFAT